MIRGPSLHYFWKPVCSEPKVAEGTSAVMLPVAFPNGVDTVGSSEEKESRPAASLNNQHAVRTNCAEADGG